MKNIILVCMIFALAGCSNFPNREETVEFEESPCACLPYFGSQLNNEPTQEELNKLYEETLKFVRKA